MKDMKIIGINSAIKIEGYEKVPAKIDTGADSSAVWASNIEFDESKQEVSFSLFGEGSPFYDRKRLKTAEYRITKVKNSNGLSEFRFKVKLSITIKNRKINAWFNLSERSRNKFPILLGRKTLNGKFLVDCSINHFKDMTKPLKEDYKEDLTIEEIKAIGDRLNKKDK